MDEDPEGFLLGVVLELLEGHKLGHGGADERRMKERP